MSECTFPAMSPMEAEPMPADAPPLAVQVAQQLGAAAAFHAIYRTAANRQDRIGARSAIVEALAARRKAEALDPHRTTPAWTGERTVHDEMVRFYEGYLARPERR